MKYEMILLTHRMVLAYRTDLMKPRCPGMEFERRGLCIRGGPNSKKLKFEWAHCFFPLHCVSEVTKKNFQLPTFNISPSSSLLHYTKEILENTKENLVF